MEAVKNRLTGFGVNAWSFIVDPDPDLVANPRHRDFDETAGRREADGIVNDRVDRPSEPVGLAHHCSTVLARTGEGKPGIAGFPACFPTVHQLLDQRTEIDALECRAGELGIRASGFADVTDQPIEPDDVFTNDAS